LRRLSEGNAENAVSWATGSDLQMDDYRENAHVAEVPDIRHKKYLERRKRP